MTQQKSSWIVTVFVITACIIGVSGHSAQANQLLPGRQTAASTETTNIALGKHVTVVTNGANDTRESPGLYPSDITDGSLDYIHSSFAQEDGTIGYVNDDYGQLMVITVTIDLNGLYDVSRIRYNMGNVWYANTWNADSMTTPFGTTSTNPGGYYSGAWTEHTGNATLSNVTVTLKKTRTTYYTDWLFIGEIEVYGTPVSGRPVFDLPINYPGRGDFTEQQFITAWQGCTTSFFDHRYPLENATNGKGDGDLVPFWGEVIPVGYTLFVNSYDGHEGYDFDDLSRCGGTSVFPVAGGTIVSAFCDRLPSPPYNYRYYGCQVRIRHGDTGYESLYGHLQEDNTFSNTESRVGSTVEASEQIGTIGCTGNCFGSHLHLSVYFEGKLVDPSGWEGSYNDPYVENRSGPTSYRLWLHSPRRSTLVNRMEGMNLVSPSSNTVVSIPSNAYVEDFEITITELAPILLPNQLASAGHGFVLEARGLGGETIGQLNQDATIEIRFSGSDIEGIRANTLSLYAWNVALNEWAPLPTTVNLPSATASANTQSLGTAITVIRDMGYIALLGEPYLVYLPIVLR